MTILLSEINKGIQAILDFLIAETRVHKSFLELLENDEAIAVEQDHEKWLAEMKQEIANLTAIKEVWYKYQEYEKEKVTDYKKRLWLQFYEELSEEMKEKINIDQTIDFEYP